MVLLVQLANERRREAVENLQREEAAKAADIEMELREKIRMFEVENIKLKKQVQELECGPRLPLSRLACHQDHTDPRSLVDK